MNKEQIIRGQRRRYMKYYLAAFSLIFAIFAFIIYHTMFRSLLTRVNDELYISRDNILLSKSFVDQQKNLRFDKLAEYFEKNLPAGAPGPDPVREFMSDFVEEFFPEDGNPDQPYKPMYSMRVHTVVRDSTGEVVNAQTLGRFFWENTLDQIPFDPARADAVTSFRMGDGSRYQSLIFQMDDSGGQPHYVQLLINVDGEQNIVDNFSKALVVHTAIFILLSITASYYLANRSMRPLIKSWERQTEFVENASHELRTPLTIIQNKLETLLTTPQATILEMADNIAVSLSETRRLSKLTSNLMTLARSDSDQTLLQKEAFPLDQLIGTLCEPYAELAELQEKTLELQLDYGEQLDADKERVHELMVILLDNALKYTHKGDVITVSTSQWEGRCVIQVKDTGIGVSQSGQSRVFDRFYREDKARSRELGGTGLGLSIAKWIVDAHKGSIHLYQNFPKGTVLEVRIPK